MRRLMRGVTPAAIQSVAFSADSSCLAVSSGRGTTHLFRLAQAPVTGQELVALTGLPAHLAPIVRCGLHDSAAACSQSRGFEFLGWVRPGQAWSDMVRHGPTG